MSSINTLVGTFSSVGSNYEVVPDELIAIDTSNNRLGINTIDPSYTIHVKDSTDSSGTIFTSKLIVNNEIFYNPTKIDISLQNFDGISYNNLIYDLSYNYFTKNKLQSGTLDLSFQNLDICGSLSVLTSITVNSQNVILQNQFDNSFGDVDTRLDNIDNSFNDLYTNIDNSFNDVYTNIDNSFNNVYIRDYIDNSFNDVYIRDYIDNSFNDVYIKDYIDNSFNDVYTKGYIDNSFNDVYTNIDSSYSTIEFSGNITGIDVSKGFIMFDPSYLYIRITDSSWGRIQFTDYI